MPSMPYYEYDIPEWCDTTPTKNEINALKRMIAKLFIKSINPHKDLPLLFYVDNGTIPDLDLRLEIFKENIELFDKITIRYIINQIKKGQVDNIRLTQQQAKLLGVKPQTLLQYFENYHKELSN